MEQQIAAELARAKRELAILHQRLQALEGNRMRNLPETALLDHSFLRRAFAVLGHYMVAALIVTVPFYILLFLIMIAVGGLW